MAEFDEKKWEIEQDYETLVKAGEISKDSKRLKKVQEFAKEKNEESTKILDADYLKSIGIGRD